MKCKHYYHHECLSTWIKEGKNICPLCREEIEDVDNVRAGLMEGGELGGFGADGAEGGDKECLLPGRRRSERALRVRQ